MIPRMPLLLLLLLFSGCSVVKHVGVSLLSEKADLPNEYVHKDIPYASASKDQMLDLYLPKTRGWPLMIFVHGGGWQTGDKDLVVGGLDVYGNIGRFYAARGIGVAVVNYRLQPAATWQQQVEDVARMAAWADTEIAGYGGDPKRIFLCGHSAGAQLALLAALQSAKNIRGVISVSGAALDLADEKTYALGEPIRYYELRFHRENDGPDWQITASPVHYVKAGDPPILILYALGEKKTLQRQSQRLAEVLKENGVRSRVLPLKGESHERMVLALSHSKKAAAPAVLDFIESNGTSF